MAKGRSSSYAIGAVCRKLVKIVDGELKSPTTIQFPTLTG